VLFKGLLAIPHFVVLLLLWIGFMVSTVVAAFFTTAAHAGSSTSGPR
jgi:hypothetical protein